jgi:S-adenosylmethionine hydrolase
MWSGKIIAVDGFGNLITNFVSSEIKSLSEKAKVWITLPGRADTIRGISGSYADVGVGKLVAVEGSSGFVEISVRDGNAAKDLGLQRGDVVTLHFRL